MDIHARLADHCCDKIPAVAARILEQQEDQASIAFLAARTPARIADILRTLLPLNGARYMGLLPPSLVRDVLAELVFEDAVALLRHLHADSRERIFAGLSSADADSFRKVLKFPAGTAGAAMTPHVVVLPGDITLAEAIRKVRTLDDDDSYFPYVVDREQRLVGLITVRGIMRNSPRRRVADVMQGGVVSVDAYSTGRELARRYAAAPSQSLPVTDAAGVLLGVLRPAAVSRLIDEVAAIDAEEADDGALDATLGGVLLDTMLHITSMIMLGGVHPKVKPDSRGDLHA